MSADDYDVHYAERQLRRSKSPIRRFVKLHYLNSVLRDVRGATVDFGCGAGQLLERLPSGSVGLEVNLHLVEALRGRQLDARPYEPTIDNLTFSNLPVGQFKTFVMSHVLEHFEDAAAGLRRVIESCERLGVLRLIIVVPGERGYSFDPTHRTFVNRAYLQDNDLLEHAGFKVTSLSHFPVNREGFGRFFTFNELKVVYDAVGAD